MLPLYDAHQHFQFESLTPYRATVIADLKDIGLKRAVVNGTSEDEWPGVAALGRQHEWILPSYGLHPWDAGNRSANWLTALRQRLEAEPHAAVGEIGLDRWIIDGLKPDDPRLAGLRVAPLADQVDVFTAQLTLATTLNRAATIHCVQAFGPLHDTLGLHSLPARGFLMHSYSGSAEMVARFADLGAYFSFNGSFLKYKNKPRLDVWKLIPPDRLLVETDAPATPLPKAYSTHHLPPAPNGEEINHPANLKAAYAALAELRGEPLEAMAARIETNFHRFFGTGSP